MHLDNSVSILWALAVILITANISGYLARAIKQPAVLGELIAGIILGNLALFGFGGFDYVTDNEIIGFLAKLGVILLLFEVGLHTKVSELMSVGMRASLVAIVGIIAPFALGFYACDFLLPELTNLAKLFIAGILTATSVGITVRVFKDLGISNSEEARIVLGAAVIDDILGLIILAVLTGVAETGHIEATNVLKIGGVSILFVAIALVIGIIIPNRAYKEPALFKIKGAVLNYALAFCFILAILADKVGLATIVGAFAAGIILEGLSLKEDKEGLNIFPIKHKINEYIEPFAYFLIPIFFVITGMHVNLKLFFDPQVVGIGLFISFLAVIGKLISGYCFPSKTPIKRALIGVSMVPRGEVGLIFAAIGKHMGIINDELYLISVMVVIVTTFVAPIFMNLLVNKNLVIPKG